MFHVYVIVKLGGKIFLIMYNVCVIAKINYPSTKDPSLLSCNRHLSHMLHLQRAGLGLASLTFRVYIDNLNTKFTNVHTRRMQCIYVCRCIRTVISIPNPSEMTLSKKGRYRLVPVDGVVCTTTMSGSTPLNAGTGISRNGSPVKG
jgi:hypothetical protein